MLPVRSLPLAAAGLLMLSLLPLSFAEEAAPLPDRATASLTDMEPVKLARDPNSKLLIAECRINGIPCNLIVDTAASHTTFDVKFIKKHFPDLALQEVQIAPGSNVHTAPRVFSMESFSIGGLLIKNFYGCTMDLDPLQNSTRIRVDGILGINYLSFCPFLLSVRDATLQFLERSRFPLKDMKPLDVERHDSGILYIRCVRDGAPFLLALDSGSTLSLAPVEQWPADPDGSHVKVMASDINGSSGSHSVMKLGVPSTLHMGPDFQMEGLSFVVTGTGGRHQIGVDTLRHFDIIVDAPQGEVYALPLHSTTEDSEKTTDAPPLKRES